MKAPLLMAATLTLLLRPAGAAEDPATAVPKTNAPAAPTWLADASGCKFLPPKGRAAISPTIEWNGACVDGFVSGPGEVKIGEVTFSGDFVHGRLVKGTAEAGGLAFTGSFVDGEPDGEIVVRKPDGTTVKAMFDRNTIDPSHAEINWPNGVKYVGSIDPATGNMDGKGVVKYSDGSIYEGEVKGGRVEGVGVMKRPDGEVRRGTFRDGQLEGKGSIVYSNQSRYEGELRAGLPHGQGRLTFTNKESYEGAFVSGKYHGQGKLLYADGSTYDGEFLAGDSSGKGTLNYADGSRYVGQFLYGKRDGIGELTETSGTSYQGEWKSDALNGKCHIVREQSIYDGQCLGGQASGPGHLEDKSHELSYQGEFARNQFEGKGSLHLGELAYEGIFKSGAMEGPGTLSVGKTRMRGEFKRGVMIHGTIDANDGRTYEIDLGKNEILEVLKDGSRRRLDELPPDLRI